MKKYFILLLILLFNSNAFVFSRQAVRDILESTIVRNNDNVTNPIESGFDRYENEIIDYNETANSGKNKIIILNRNDVKGINLLTQEMLTIANTIYVIQHDYVLNNDITIPKNCVLKFEGGSISGGYSIIGQDTGIEADLVQIFGDNTIFSGTWIVNELNIRWFGAKGDNKTNDTRAFKNCIESPAVSRRLYKVLINQGIYLIDNTIYLPKIGVFLSGVSREQLYYDETFKTCIKFIGENKDLFRIKGDTRSITIEKLCFKSYRQEGIDYKNNIAIKAMPEASNTHTSKNITIRDCYFVGFGYGLYVSGIRENIDWQCDNELIENCTFEYFAKGGIYMNSRNCFDYSLIKSCSFAGRPLDNNIPAYGLDIRRCGFFKMTECSGATYTENVNKRSVAARKSAGVNIEDMSAIGNIVFDQIQFEATPRIINVYNLSGGKRSITFTNSIFDAPLHISGMGDYYFHECNFNDSVLIEGNDISLYNVPPDKISLVDDFGFNSFDYVFIDKSSRVLYIQDLSLLKSVNTTVDQILNPHSKHFDVSPSSKEVKWHVVNTINPFSELRAIKVNLWGKYTIGNGGYINVKAKIDNGSIISLGVLTENDVISGSFIKEYMYCSKLIDPKSNYFYLETKNVTGSFDAKVEVMY